MATNRHPAKASQPPDQGPATGSLPQDREDQRPRAGLDNGIRRVRARRSRVCLRGGFDRHRGHGGGCRRRALDRGRNIARGRRVADRDRTRACRVRSHAVPPPRIVVGGSTTSSRGSRAASRSCRLPGRRGREATHGVRSDEPGAIDGYGVGPGWIALSRRGHSRPVRTPPESFQGLRLGFVGGSSMTVVLPGGGASRRRLPFGCR